MARKVGRPGVTGVAGWALPFLLFAAAAWPLVSFFFLLLGLADGSKDREGRGFEVEGVEVEAGCAGLDEFGGHVDAVGDAEVLELLVVVLAVGDSSGEVRGNPRFAEVGHFLEARGGLDDHDPGDDGAGDAGGAGGGDEGLEGGDVEEHLRNDDVRARVDFFFQIGEFLGVVGVGADVGLAVFADATSHLLRVGELAAFGVDDDVGVALRISRDGDVEVVAVRFANELHEVQGAGKALVRRLPLVDAHRRVPSQSDDVPYAVVATRLQRVDDFVTLDVRTSQVHVRVQAHLLQL
mmetsp:Transcript_986/g.3357  ORF Transcript_986/g.3357 Transcript_986/m.3357 type:complete len:294 (+) Transcript_986:213-1094(+)